MNYEQQGYDAWVERWCAKGYAPTAGECPARWMNDDEKRSAFIRGWNKAKKEHQA